MLQNTLHLSYFPLWAKGPGPALALAHSGLRWRGTFPLDWSNFKPTTAWSKLPILEVPDGSGGTMQIAHELAILAYIGRAAPTMAGESEADFIASQQIACESEDIYAKLTKYQPTTRQPNKCTPAELDALWTVANTAAHNREQGLQVNLANLNAFAGPDGRFTTTGRTVGECKLFSTLHSLVLIEENVLMPFGKLSAFYERFSDHDATRAIINDGGEMPGKFEQYFVRGVM